MYISKWIFFFLPCLSPNYLGSVINIFKFHLTRYLVSPMNTLAILISLLIVSNLPFFGLLSLPSTQISMTILTNFDFYYKLRSHHIYTFPYVLISHFSRSSNDLSKISHLYYTHHVFFFLYCQLPNTPNYLLSWCYITHIDHNFQPHYNSLIA